ncbi:sodium/glucose cotransporter 4-like isoform X2 [Daphnia carinata]|uniref:sodium/glucose cotransporter 4-like isoform X2 n=1 Tax=Daphnia carinata TaxID=120202 RepID=UPI0028684DBE|nr:sodium/glucose cotransporter 4-like isoform X2 [Daphnia carinata]
MDKADSTLSVSSSLEWPDYVVIAIYFVGILAVGLWSGRSNKQDSISGYFLASRNMHWIPVGASLFASNIGSGHFVGLSGSGAASGIGNAAFELNAMFVLILLGYVFVPVYMASGVYTMPEYLRLRFGGQRIRVYLSVLALLLYVFTKISADLFSGAIFIQQAMGLEGDAGIYISILILLGIAALFTITGGLTAVIWTDFVQTIIMLIGSFILMGMAFVKVGGYSELIRQFFMAYPSENYTAYDLNNRSCANIPPDAMHLFKSITSPELPWTGVVFGVTISSIWYWCSDQVIVQRTLAAKSMNHAKGGCIMASFLKILPLFIIIFPGMASRVLYTDRVACADPQACEKICGSQAGCTNIAYAELVINLLPPGLTGLMLSVMLAALMSSLTSIFNSSSTIFTMDIWTRIRKNPSDIELLIVGRVSCLLLVAIGVLWVPIIQNVAGSQLFTYMQQVQNILSPPVSAVFLLAVFWPRTNEPGAFWGLMVGLIVGLIRFGLEFGYVIPPCGTGLPDPRPEVIKKIVGNVHYLHFGCILFVISLVTTVLVSLITEPIDEKYLYRLTFWSRHSSQVRSILEDNDNSDKSQKETTPIMNADSSTTASNDSVNELNEPQPIVDNAVELPVWRKAINCLCGVETQKVTQDTTAVVTAVIDPKQEALMASEFIKEDPKWFRFVNTNAILVMSVSAFMWAWYA